MKEKIEFKFLGIDFNTTGYITNYDNEKRIIIDCVGSGKMVKQYIKKMYPGKDIKVWVRSDRYSGGSSLSIHLSKKDGSEVDRNIYEDVKSFGRTLQMGRFDGMIDMYEIKDEVYHTNDGVEIEFFTKFVFTYNEPPYGSKEYEMSKELELV